MQAKIGTKITLGFGIVIALMLGMAIYSAISIRNVNADLVKINNAIQIENGGNNSRTSELDGAKALIAESIATGNRSIAMGNTITGIVLLLGGATAIFLTNSIRKPIVELISITDQYAKGDLRKTVTSETDDEIGQLSRSIGMMHKSFVGIIQNIRGAAEQLAETSEEMAASTEEVTAKGEEISGSMQNLSQEASTGNQSVMSTADTLMQLSSLIQNAKTKADDAGNNSGNTLIAAENGRVKIDESVSKMGNIKDQAQKSSHIIAELNDYSKQISQITDTITTLAKQTNLLALNAAIEAARAGEHGRGFAVVAEEVRKLAEQSDRGAQEITSLVKMITEKTNVAVAAMAQNVVEVEYGVATVNEAGVALDRILGAAKDTTTEIEGIGQVTDQQVASSEQIIELICQLATVVETVAAQGQQVSASAQEQAAALQTVAASAEETSAMAYELKSSVSKFLV